MLMHLKTFFKRDSGAVSVDWVVLTAALVGLGLGLGLISVFANSTDDVGDVISSRITNMGTGAPITF